MAQNPEHTRPRTAAFAAAGAGLWALLLALVLTHPPDGHEHGDLGQFIGRLHPVLVHGPVALLLLVPLMELAGLRPAWAHLRAAAGWVLALATAAALAAALDGWLLAWSGGLRGRDVTRHMWGGVGLSAACLLAAGARAAPGRGRARRAAYLGLLLGSAGLVVWTGHGGGAISHGDAFLTEKMPAGLRAWLGMAPAPAEAPAAAAPAPARGGPGSADPGNTAFYGLHVAPILARSCVKCHRPEKHKGGLRMDSLDQLLRGGDDGRALVPGNPGSSDLLRRVRLPAGDDDFMPSDNEKPLTPEEIRTLERWIAAGAKGG